MPSSSLPSQPLPQAEGEPSPPRPEIHWVQSLFWSLLAWSAVSILMTATLYADAARRGGSSSSAWVGLQDSLGALGFMALYTWLLHLCIERWPQRWTQARQLAGLYVLCVGVVVPLAITAKVATVMWRLDRPWHRLLANLGRQEGVLWWFEFMVVTGTFAAVVGLSAWQRSRRRERDWAIAQSDNLRLRLTLLQGQLEPHFLFNTLNGVSSLVRAGERGQALSALSRVSELLRYALRVSRLDWVTVQDELDFVRDYLALQSLRFGDGLRLSWQLDEVAEWERAACPPLLLQPLVENAIRHGLEASGGAGRVHIALHRQGERWRLCIENARGDPAAPSAGHGLGLSATRERLAMLYGSTAQLHTRVEGDASGEGEIFFLEMSLPWRDVSEYVERTDR